jgi:type VI secretion system secreted protein VgrG
MHFDQRDDRSDGTKTLPIRMEQAYSGPDYGIHFPNHADTEMIVAFENGDIDRPVALGTSPNPSNTSPSVSENKMENIVRTHADNQLIMDDTQDETKVRLESADRHKVVLDDKEDRIRLTSTDKHTATLDDRNENIEVQTKDGHYVIMDDANKKITVQSKAGHFITIHDDDEVITIADESEENMFSIDIGNEKLTIKTEKGDIDMHAPKGTIDIQAKELNTETTGDTNMKAANISAEADSDYDMKATNITAEANMDYEQKGTNVTSEASMKHEIKGMQVSSEGQAKNDLKGAMVNVKASGISQIQGSLVKIN